MKFVSEKQFIEMFQSEDMKGASFVSLVTATTPKLLSKGKKTKQPRPASLNGLRRHAVRNGMIGANYENVVNNQRAREGNEKTFDAHALWNGKGKHVNPFIVEHVGTSKKYLAFYPKHDDGDVKVSQSSWFVGVNEVNIEDIAEFLPEPSVSSRQETETNIPWRVVAIDSILSMKINGETFMIAR